MKFYQCKYCRSMQIGIKFEECSDCGFRDLIEISKEECELKLRKFRSDWEMKKYAVWKDGIVIDYIELTEDQTKTLNRMFNFDIFIGFDKHTNPEYYNDK